MRKVGYERNRLPVSFTINSCVDTEDSRFLAITIDVLHTGLNFNGSIFEKEVVDANADSIMNTPVLGYIALNPDGELDFQGHEYKTVKDENGKDFVYKRLTQDATAAAGKFASDPTTKELTFHEDDAIADGTSIVVYYIRNVEGDVISNISDNYSETVEMYVDALAEDKCHNIYHVQFYIPYADFTGSFDLAMGDSQTTHGFEATSLASACTNGGTKFWDMTVFGEQEDAA